MKPDVNIDITRREFHRLCAIGSSLPIVSAMTGELCASAHAATKASSKNVPRTVKFRDGTIVPALGQGSAGLAEDKRPAAVEEEALRTGLSLGMSVIDTAEIYGKGRSEELIGRAIAGQRVRVFLVSKVHPDHVVGDGMARACEASLARLNTDYLDLYLLHWRTSGLNLSSVVREFENLRAAKKIRAWGVSNFGVKDMEDLFHVPHGDHCATNQVLYNLGERTIERDLLPWCKRRGMPVMAYTPLGGSDLLRDPALGSVAAERGCSASAVALAWAIRGGNVIAIPRSGSAAHVKENAVALSLVLTPKELRILDRAHPFNRRK